MDGTPVTSAIEGALRHIRNRTLQTGGVMNLCMLGALWLGSTGLFADETIHAEEEYGFRIRHSAQLQARVDTPRRGDDYTLAIRPAEGSPRWQLLVRVSAVDPGTTATSLLERSLEIVRADPRYTIDRTLERMLAGNPATGISLRYDTGELTYRLEALFLVAHDLRYILQSSAPVEEYSDHAAAIEKLLASFELLEISEERRAGYRLKGLAARCGSEIDWVPTWAAAATKANAENKLVFVVARFYPGFQISDELAAGALFDANIVRLIQERFVPYRLKSHQDVPFGAHEQYGLGPSTFGQGILLVSPEGEVVGETYTPDPVVVDAFLLEALAKREREGLPAVAETRSITDRAQAHFERGELDEAAKLLADANDAGQLRLRAALLARRRQGPEALGDLHRARELAGDELSTDLAVEEAVVLARLGRTEDAVGMLRSVLENDPDSARAAEAGYWLGACLAALGHRDQAEARLREVTVLHADDRWSWKAAATITSTAFEMGIDRRLQWPDVSMLEAVLTPRRRLRPPAAGVERAAVEYLLRLQRADGSWIVPSELGRLPGNPPNPLRYAVAPIAARSLLPHRRLPEARKAIELTLTGVLDHRKQVRKKDEIVHFMDYWVWTKLAQLWFLADTLRADIGNPATIRAAMGRLVEELRARQRRTGGWSYYVTRDLGSGHQDTMSISFVTAAVALALLEARDAGVRVPREMIANALDCLEAMREPGGSYAYMGGVGAAPSKRRTVDPEAAGRGPLCTLALYRGKRIELGAVREAVEVFIAHRQGFARQQGKVLMHAGPEGQGSHYLLFDYAMTAAAVHELPADERAAFAEPLLELIGQAAYEDGGYVDNPLLGRVYGTAMALLAFHDLDEESSR